MSRNAGLVTDSEALAAVNLKARLWTHAGYQWPCDLDNCTDVLTLQ